MGRRNWLRWVLPAAALVLVSAAGLSAFYIDVLWFRTLGYDQVFWHILLVQAAAGVAAGLIFGGIFFLNLAAALRSLVRLPFGALPPRVEAWLRARPLTLAALVDAGVDLAKIQAGVASLGLRDVRITAADVKRKGFRGLHVTIEHPPEHAHRHLHHITGMIEQSQMTPAQQSQ